MNELCFAQQWLKERKASFTFRPIVTLTSMGADPIHRGHVRNLLSAAKIGDILIVLVMKDSWLIRKKGYALLPEVDRTEIVAAIKGVDYVVPYHDGSPHVAEAIAVLRPDVWVKGGDRTPENLAACEVAACESIDCQIITGIGGQEKVQSSSQIVERFLDNAGCKTERRKGCSRQEENCPLCRSSLP